MTVARSAQGLKAPLDRYPLLRILREREQLQARVRRRQVDQGSAIARLAALDAMERQRLDELREVLAKNREVTQEKVARACRVDRTMVNKVWNAGKDGRPMTRSARIVAATYRALEAAGWSPIPAPEAACAGG